VILDLLRDCLAAFHLETQPWYRTSATEEEAVAGFLAGNPRSPGEYPEWRSWLDEMRELTGQGKRISRVRVVDDPPTGYQRWAMWCTRWHAEAGEDIRYLPRATAGDLGIPSGDWWLFDDATLVVTAFTSDGQADGRTLITNPALVGRYVAWRDTAVRHATAAEPQATPTAETTTA
jgi:hypothetical protein